MLLTRIWLLFMIVLLILAFGLFNLKEKFGEFDYCVGKCEYIIVLIFEWLVNICDFFRVRRSAPR